MSLTAFSLYTPMIVERTFPQPPGSGEESQKVGAIDMGSKNFKFSFGQLVNGNITTELIRKERLEIGKEVTENHGMIGREKLRQIEETLWQFKRYCTGRGATTVLAIATSAIRNARNHHQVVDLAHEIGLSIELAEGEREGVIGYLAATGGAPNKLVSDSGSKSMQVAWQVNGEIVSRSVPVGYELAYESFVEHASMLDETRENFGKFLDGNFRELPEKTDQLIALAANSVTSFVTGESLAGYQGRVLTKTALDSKISELAKLSPSEYNNLKSSLPKAEKILPGVVFLDYLMSRTGHDKAYIAEAELPVGLIVEYFLRQGFREVFR